MSKLSETTITKSVIDRSRPDSSTYEIHNAELRGFILRVYPTEQNG